MQLLSHSRAAWIALMVGCAAATVVPAGCTAPELCTDDLDNDGDGLVDCQDPVCALAAPCARCGDGELDATEGCDDGNTLQNDGCSARCLIEGCGDGVRAAPEQCDDGNLVPADGCDFRCRYDYCGNGRIDSAFGEECDDGNANDQGRCTSACKFRTTSCGNGIVEPVNGEQCDDGNAVNDDGCTGFCTLPFCGDGLWQPSRGEQCDGFDGPGGQCDFSCRLSLCGNGVHDPGELCDSAIDPGCTFLCTLQRCGDGMLSGDEQCDDRNRAPNDGCSATCRTEFCGDGARQPRLGEECDAASDAVQCEGCALRGVCVNATACFSAARIATFFGGSGDAALVVRSSTSTVIFSLLFGGIGQVAINGGVPTFFEQPFAPRSPLQLAAADLDGDGVGELLVASNDGAVSVWDADLQTLDITFLSALALDIDAGDVAGTSRSDVFAPLFDKQLMLFVDPRVHASDLAGGVQLLTLPAAAQRAIAAPVFDAVPTERGSIVLAVESTLRAVHVEALSGALTLDAAAIPFAGRVTDLAAVDLDDDGHRDLAVLTTAPDILWGVPLDGTSLSDRAFALVDAPGADHVRSFDIDADGADDLLLTGGRGTFTVLLHSTAFAESVVLPAPAEARPPFAADVDGDGVVDQVVLTGSTAPMLTVLTRLAE